MAKYGRGLICLALTEDRCDELNLPPMSPVNTSALGTAFTESIDARRGTTTGISAADRATTILAAIDPATRPADLARPGHVFPLRARRGGVLVRAGQTEASVDLARIAGLYPAGVICEIMNDDGTMARLPQLDEFCREHGLKLLTVAELIRYRMRHERYVRRVAEGVLPTRYGDFRMIVFSSDIDREQHVALVRGDLGGLARRRWCACIRTASPATCSARPPAIATKWWRARSKPSRARIAACSSTCTRPAAASPSSRPPPDPASCRGCSTTRAARTRPRPRAASGNCSTKAASARRF